VPELVKNGVLFMRRGATFACPPPHIQASNELDALSSDAALALKCTAVFMSEFIQRCPQFSPLVTASLPGPQALTTADFTDVTRRHKRLNDEHQAHIAQSSQIQEGIASLASRLDQENVLLLSRLDDRSRRWPRFTLSLGCNCEHSRVGT
jgi:hypothetical protein